MSPRTLWDEFYEVGVIARAKYCSDAAGVALVCHIAHIVIHNTGNM